METQIVIDSFGHFNPADSKEEVWISKAIEERNLLFRFQYPIKGGSLRKGGYIIDWLVHYAGWVAVEFQGPYWHDQRRDVTDLLKRKYLERKYKRVVYIDGIEVNSPEDAKRIIAYEFP